MIILHVTDCRFGSASREETFAPWFPTPDPLVAENATTAVA